MNNRMNVKQQDNRETTGQTSNNGANVKQQNRRETTEQT